MESLNRLLPRPRTYALRSGVWRVGRETPIENPSGDVRVSAAAMRWRNRIPISLNQSRVGALRIEVDRSLFDTAESYRLIVRQDGAVLVGASAAGCFYGLQTLQQLQDLRHESAHVGEAVVACVDMEDAPDFAIRGFMHDITRGKVPTLSTLCNLVDRLALLKCNQLQLYIEHAFVWTFDPELCDANNGITPDEVVALERYCTERFVQLVPAVANLGHMGFILSREPYRHLAEVAAPACWANLSWAQRARGFTLDVANPESHELVRRIWDDILGCFRGSTVNICGDEPWDLGAGKNQNRFNEKTKAMAYVQHLSRVSAQAEAHGRTVQFWSDVVKRHLDIVDDRLGRGTILHWGYDDNSDYAATGELASKGFATVVCPGTSGWKRIVNAVATAQRNITAFAEHGKRCGAVGLMNTDWGDHGHFQPISGSWLPLAIGAAKAWRVDHPIDSDFDCAVARVMFREESGDIVTRLRAFSELGDSCETWRLFWQSVDPLAPESFPSLDQVRACASASWDAAAALGPELSNDAGWVRSSQGLLASEYDGTREAGGPASLDRREIMLAARFSALFAERMLAMHPLAAPTDIRVDPSEWAQRLRSLKVEYVSLWNLRNKPSGLADIAAALDRLECSPVAR